MEASDFIKEFRVMIIKMPNTMKEDIETIKKEQSEIKNVNLKQIHWKE